MFIGKKLKNYKLRSFIKNNWPYLLPYLLALVTSLYFLLQYDKVSIHVNVNSIVGNPYIDAFFKYFTHAGDGFVCIIIAVIVLLYNMRNGLFVLLTYAISGTTTNILKRYVYDVDRPHSVFGYYIPDKKLTFVDGVEMLGFNSFPSGHSTSAFAIFTSLALITENKILKFVYFLCAFLAAFSRTYLSQHWLVDITVGSLIGSMAAILFYLLIIQANNLQKINKPLMKFFNP
jgi:membrane-associated phospholipid phosphatase